MTSKLIHRDAPPSDILPRAHRDAHQRFRTHGPVQPMDYPRRSLWQRIMGRWT